MTAYTIRPTELQEAQQVAALAIALWPGHSPAEMTEEFVSLLADPEARVFLACAGETPVGFAQCQLRRDYVEGCDSSPVGYLEGIYVAPECRGKGLARQLLAACEAWARAQGCREFASDCELDNDGSLQFHLLMGFSEANRIICFTKKL